MRGFKFEITRNPNLFDKSVETSNTIAFSFTYKVVNAILKNKSLSFIPDQYDTIDLRAFVVAYFARRTAYRKCGLKGSKEDLTYITPQLEEAYALEIMQFISDNNITGDFLTELSSYKLQSDIADDPFDLRYFTELFEVHLYSLIPVTLLHKEDGDMNEYINTALQIVSGILTLNASVNNKYLHLDYISYLIGHKPSDHLVIKYLVDNGHCSPTQDGNHLWFNRPVRKV